MRVAGVADVAVALAVAFDQHGVLVAVDPAAFATASRLPDVSPLVHSVLRVRLKKVT